MNIHDLIFSAGSLVLFLALLPALYHKTVMPISTTSLTGAVLFVFTLNYWSLHFWYATIVSALGVFAWAYLFLLSLRHDLPKA